MKRFLKISGTSAFLLFLMFTWNGCDQFNSLPLNIPFTVDVEVQGSGNTLTNSATFNLSSDSQTYNDYRDNIKSLHFIEAAYRTLNYSPANLSGDITVSLTNGNGDVLFSYQLPAVDPGTYKKPNSPYIFQLNQQQIDFINSYLEVALNSGASFTATMTVTNLTGQPPYDVHGAIDMVIEADTEF